MAILRHLGLLAIVGAIAAPLGCGAADPAPPPTTATGGDAAQRATEYEDRRQELGRLSRADLQACEEPGADQITGYDWRAAVAGVSCERVGRFIQERIFPAEVTMAIASEAEFAADGFGCFSRTLAQETGWRVSCASDQAQFIFNWNP